MASVLPSCAVNAEYEYRCAEYEYDDFIWDCRHFGFVNAEGVSASQPRVQRFEPQRETAQPWVQRSRARITPNGVAGMDWSIVADARTPQAHRIDSHHKSSLLRVVRTTKKKAGVVSLVSTTMLCFVFPNQPKRRQASFVPVCPLNRGAVVCVFLGLQSQENENMSIRVTE